MKTELFSRRNFLKALGLTATAAITPECAHGLSRPPEGSSSRVTLTMTTIFALKMIVAWCKITMLYFQWKFVIRGEGLSSIPRAW